MLPIKRAQLFLERCPIHIKRQFAEDSELFVGITWLQFKTRMAKVWNSAVKKRRTMINLGLDFEDSIIPKQKIPEGPPVPDYPPAPYPPAPSPVSRFNADVDDVMVENQCKEDGCGPFQYSEQKIQWMKDKFKENFHMPSRCVKHKAIVDAERNGSPPENPDVPSDQPPPLKN